MISDLISRQAAIDALHTWFRDGFNEDKWWNSTHVLAAIEGLPPAQPEPCEDAVSRKAAIAQMQGLPKWNGIIADSCVDFEDVISVLENKENLPPVTQKQRTGKWIPSDSQCGIRCSVCGVPVDDFCHSIDYIDLNYEPNFCSHCGAKMEGVAE